MASFYKKNTIKDHLSYYHKGFVVNLQTAISKEISFRVKFFLIPSFFFSPIIFYTLTITIIIYFIINFYKEFFKNRDKLERYKAILSPKTSSTALAHIGYQLFENEVDQHIDIVKTPKKTNKEKLAKQQKEMMKWKNRWRWVSLSKEIMTTHMHIVGKTGAGKTEIVRTIFDEACLKVGGGGIYVDGKAEIDLFKQFASQASNAGRETSLFVMNFLAAEKGSETNTFSPVGIMHPTKIVEFFSELTGNGDGGGNAKYFAEQGKAMLFPVISITYHRNTFYQEGYTLERIFENTKLSNMIILFISTYCELKEINEIIKDNTSLSGLTKRVTTVEMEKNLKFIEKLVEYVSENPISSEVIEREINIPYRNIKELYVNGYVLMGSYLHKMWGKYGEMLDVVSRSIYEMMKNEKYIFHGEGGAKINDIKKYTKILKELSEDEKEGKRLLDEKYELFKSGLVKENEFSLIQNTFHREPTKGGNITSPPADAVQQLAYAQQQYSALSNIFALYKHVFGQSKPEIDPMKLLKDNKFLYVLLPALGLSKNFIAILGKMVVGTIKEIANITIMGEKLSSHQTLANILKDRLTPKPFTFVTFDEYGAYPVDYVDILFAQMRSLNVGIAVSTQDNISLKVDGTNEASAKKALANTLKIIPKIEDEDVVSWVKNMLSDVKIESPKMQMDYRGNLVGGADVEIKEKKSFEVERLRDLGMGFTLILMGSKEEDLVWTQSFYKGGEVKTVMIKRYENLELL